MGGQGALRLAMAVEKVCQSSTSGEVKFLYDLDQSIESKIETIAREMYGAEGILMSDLAKKKVEVYTRQGFGCLPICMAKTHLSFSHDPKLKGVPKGFFFFFFFYIFFCLRGCGTCW